VPSRGAGTLLLGLLDGLAHQTYPRNRFEIIVALDGSVASDAVRSRLESLHVIVVPLRERAGPGAARNRAAALATGEFLAFTEDDVVPAADWLARAAARLDAEPSLDVLEGHTIKPSQRSAEIPANDLPLYLPTNLFIRRALFEQVGGYSEAFYDARRGLYFREDSDLGFTLEAAGARIAREPAVLVKHPVEHTRWLDPLRWARRYELDALLAARHPRRFRERIEVQRFGPFRVRRRSCARRSCTSSR
jgi:glycosyltransferase involved in cell wall biosynthesis